MSAKHTPGPWACHDTSNYAHDYRLFRPDGMPLPLNVIANDHSEQRANARLIATAPDLLEAAQRLSSRGFFTPVSCADEETLRDMALMLAAIAKATGAAS